MIVTIWDPRILDKIRLFLFVFLILFFCVFVCVCVGGGGEHDGGTLTSLQKGATGIYVHWSFKFKSFLICK